MDYLRVDSSDSEAAGLLQRCRLLTHSAGTTNKTWSMDDYLIPHSDIKFTDRVIGRSCSTQVNEAELFGILCAVKMPLNPCDKTETISPLQESEISEPKSHTNQKFGTLQVKKQQSEDRGWSLSQPKTHNKIKVQLRKMRSHSIQTSSDTDNSLYHTARLSGDVNLDGLSKILKECRMLSTLHHPNIVQFYGVCWLEPREDMSKTAIIVEELMLLTLKEVATSFREKIGGKLPLAMKLSLLNDTARGLSFLHSYTPSIIHPNLDATDVMISSAMVAKITDLHEAQYGSAKQQDVTALGHIGSVLMNLTSEELTTVVLEDMEAELASILTPCLATDAQNKPSLSKLIGELEKISKRVPFQLSEMGTMMVAIKEWQRDQRTPPTTPSQETPAVKKSPSIEHLLKLKDEELVELREKNSELLAAKKTIEKQLAEQEDLLHGEFTDGVKLSDMLASLHPVVGWFLLGIHLGVPLSDLQKIRQQFSDNVDQCKTEMLITYSKLSDPSWTDIVKALRKCGERALAARLARRYGVTLDVDDEELTDSQNFEATPFLLVNGTGSSELESDIKALVSSIRSKDQELRDTLQQLEREQTTKEELQQEMTLLKSSLSSVGSGDVTFQQSRQKLTQQLFLKERERHYLSLVSIQNSSKDKSLYGSEIDVIMIEKDMEIHRMKTQLKELETEFRREKAHTEELKTKLSSLESEVIIKDAHILELEKSKEDLNKYLNDERHRVDMLFMKVVPPPQPPPPEPVTSEPVTSEPVTSEPVTFQPTPLQASRELLNIPKEDFQQTFNVSEPTPAKNCCVIS